MSLRVIDPSYTISDEASHLLERLGPKETWPKECVALIWRRSGDYDRIWIRFGDKDVTALTEYGGAETCREIGRKLRAGGVRTPMLIARLTRYDN